MYQTGISSSAVGGRGGHAPHTGPAPGSKQRSSFIRKLDRTSEGHILPDWLPIYREAGNEWYLARTGTRADLFGRCAKGRGKVPGPVSARLSRPRPCRMRRAFHTWGLAGKKKGAPWRHLKHFINLLRFKAAVAERRQGFSAAAPAQNNCAPVSRHPDCHSPPNTFPAAGSFGSPADPPDGASTARWHCGPKYSAAAGFLLDRYRKKQALR